MAEIRILGAKEADAYLKNIGAASREAGRTVVRVGTALKYGHGIEFGRHRGGKLARRAGGAFYLTGAFRQVQPRIKRELAAALPKGAAAVLGAMRRLAADVERIAKQRVPVRTGNLRRSIHTVTGR